MSSLNPRRRLQRQCLRDSDMANEKETRRPMRVSKCLLILLLVAVPVLVVLQKYLLNEHDWTSSGPDELTRQCKQESENATFSTYQCVIPNHNPFDKTIRSYIFPPKPVDCGRKPQLSYINKTEEGYVLGINQYFAGEYSHPGRALSCCYSNVTRFTIPPGGEYGKNADWLYNVSSCSSFEKEILLKEEEEFIIVECYSVDDSGISRSFVYRQMHSVVPMKQSVLKRIKKRAATDNRLNVLLVVYDSMSRLNLQRTMPKTLELLENKGFVTFTSLNKVGEGMFPNGAAMMSGLSMDDLQSTCWKNRAKLDDCPFIWREFEKFGYVTHFSHEGSCLGCEMHGGTFVKQPTDYYQRPVFVAGEDYRSMRYSHGLPLCHGSMHTTDQLYQYLTHFVTTFKDYLHFSVTWFSNFCHGDINEPAAMDSRTMQFFKDLSSDVYNNTLVIFTSDHGRRYGPAKEKTIGWYEERLPYLYISLPEWVKKKYSQRFDNLVSNRQKLISTHNIYVTLKDFLYTGNNISLPKNNVSWSCPKCRSLFSEEVGGSSCYDLGIPSEFCACIHVEEKPVTDFFIRAAIVATNRVQTIINMKAKPYQCASLRLHAVINAGYIHSSNRQSSLPCSKDILVTFQTQPGGAHMQAILNYGAAGKSEFSILGSVMRLNEYREESNCVDDTELKRYCLCLYP